jgi:hypothetical protein
MTYTDKWVILKITSDNTIYKVFATFYGDYSSGDSWRINSGIVRVEEGDGYFDFIGHSGSVYRCWDGTYGVSNYSSVVLSNTISKAEESGIKISILDKNTNWLKL